MFIKRFLFLFFICHSHDRKCRNGLKRNVSTRQHRCWYCLLHGNFKYIFSMKSLKSNRQNVYNIIHSNKLHLIGVTEWVAFAVNETIYTLYSFVASFEFVAILLHHEHSNNAQWNEIVSISSTSLYVHSGLCTLYSAQFTIFFPLVPSFARLLLNTVWGVLAIGKMYTRIARRGEERKTKIVSTVTIYSFAIDVSAEKWVRSCQRLKILSVWPYGVFSISCGGEKLDSNLAICARWARVHVRR